MQGKQTWHGYALMMNDEITLVLHVDEMSWVITIIHIR